MNQISQFLIENLPQRSSLWPALYVIFGIFMIASAVLIYHWHMYTDAGPDKLRIKSVQLIYFLGAAAFFLLMLTALFKYPQNS